MSLKAVNLQSQELFYERDNMYRIYALIQLFNQVTQTAEEEEERKRNQH